MLVLNSVQEQAVKYTEGNSLVIAGAGSGKTRTLIAKIIYLLQHKQVRPRNILAITFTNKAAKEMRERLHALLAKEFGDEIGGLQIRTFHAFGSYLLRRFIDQLGLVSEPQQNNTGEKERNFGLARYRDYTRNFTIIDPDDQKRILHKLYSAYSVADFPFKTYSYIVSQCKNNFLYPGDENFNNKLSSYYDNYRLIEDPAEVYDNYMNFLTTNNLLDFDDLIGLAIKILRTNSRVAEKVGSWWKYVLVDEYQDTNHAQEEFINFFIHQGAKVTVVGDDQQSIYGFRGAKMDNILSFKKKYTFKNQPVEVFILEENYRSTEPILQLANHVIAKNPGGFKKNLFTRSLTGTLPVYHRFPNDLEEARFVVEKIKELSDRIPLKDIAIFFRTNYQSRIIEDILVRSRIHYHIVKGQKFYERKEIKDVLAYLQWLINPQDQVSFERIVNTPARGIGEKSVARIFDYLSENTVALKDVFDSRIVSDLISRKNAREQFTILGEVLSGAQQKIAEEESPGKILNFIIQKSGLQKLYESEKDPHTRDQRLGNIDSLFNALDDFVKQTGGGLVDFITSLALGESEEDNTEEGVNLMTIHNAKGLEFRVVFVLGMEEEVFPHQLAMNTDQEIEEERRLFYVAITRAREELHLSSAQLKYRYNSMNELEESRFITEVDEKYLEKKTHHFDYSAYDSYNQGNHNDNEHEYY